MTELEFCKLHSAFHGEDIDSVKQLTTQVFNGEELYEFCLFVVDNVPRNLVVANSFEDLFKAIEKIDVKHYGSAKNFIERYINSANVE